MEMGKSVYCFSFFCSDCEWRSIDFFLDIKRVEIGRPLIIITFHCGNGSIEQNDYKSSGVWAIQRLEVWCGRAEQGDHSLVLCR